MQDNVKRNKKKYQILAVLFLAWFIGYFDRVAINVAAIPLVKDFGFSAAQVGLIMSIFYLGYAPMQLVGGWMADKFGSRRILLGAITVWSIFTGLTGAAWNLTSFLVVRFLFGVGEGPFPAATSVTVAELFEKEKRARAKSVLLSAQFLAVALGTVAVAALMGVAGWRAVFWILGLAGFLILGVFWSLLRKMKTVTGTSLDEVKKVPIKKLLKITLVWKLMVVMFGYGIFNWGLISWMPSYWVNEKHLSLISMGILMGLPPLGAFLVSNINGWLLDKYLMGKEKYLIAFGALLAAGSLYLMSITPSITMGVVYMIFAISAVAVIATSCLTMPLKHLPDEIVGSATGLLNFGGQCAGIFSAAIMGFMISFFNGSYTAAFWFLMACIFVSFLTALTIKSGESLT